MSDSTTALQQWTHTGFAQRIWFAPGAIAELGEIVRAVGLRRVLLITTAGRLGSVEGERVRANLGSVLASTFADITSHVPTPTVEAAVRQARRDGVDGIVSFGGGSCADAGKAVCWFSEQEAGTPGMSWLDRPALPHVAVPTTYSGAELTPFFGMTDPHTRRKQGAGGPTVAPQAVVYDPELTRSTPARVSAETGMNALGHCVEVAWSPTRSPEAEAIALDGARRIVDSLRQVVGSPDDLDARNDMLIAAALAGRALQNGTMGVHHGLSQLIGGRTGIPHGLANAVILPHAIRYNAEVVPNEVARIGEAIGAQGDAAAGVAAFVETLGLPTHLGDCGVDEEDLDVVARLSQQNPSVRNNPRPVSEDDARAILAAAW